MQSTSELRLTFKAAFSRYSAAVTLMRDMRAAFLGQLESIHIHQLNEQQWILSRAERDYRAARLAYAGRLLDRPTPP